MHEVCGVSSNQPWQVGDLQAITWLTRHLARPLESVFDVTQD
jgi:hypothetical protein